MSNENFWTIERRERVWTGREWYLGMLIYRDALQAQGFAAPPFDYEEEFHPDGGDGSKDDVTIRLRLRPEDEEVTTPLERLAEIRRRRRVLDHEEADIYRASLKATDPSAKVCADGMAELLADPSLRGGELNLPLTVRAFTYMHGRESFFPWKPSPRRPLPWVQVRPVGEQFGGRTYLGIHIGDLAVSYMASISAEGILQVGPAMHNPAIYVMDLKTIILGCESWWAGIASPEQLRKITDAEIDSVWYVRALRDLTEAASEAKEA